MSIIDTPAGEQNFKVNLWLSNVIDDYTNSNREARLEWDKISPELQAEINRLSYQLKKCMDLSNKECQKLV